MGEEEEEDLDCSELLFFSGLHINNTDQLKSFLDICVSSGQVCLSTSFLHTRAYTHTLCAQLFFDRTYLVVPVHAPHPCQAGVLKCEVVLFYVFLPQGACRLVVEKWMEKTRG